MTMPTEDRLLKIDEAAQVLGTSEDWLYHNWKKLPFERKWSPRQLRFFLKGLQRYIEEQQYAKTAERGVPTR
jgi:predicted DNA-binding transcriptional regulator AlpA